MDVNRTPGRDRPFQWRLRDLLNLYFYCGVLLIALGGLANNIYDPNTGKVILLLGGLGIWRYGWWLTHFIRATIYRRHVFRRKREAADRLWASGWRPQQLYFMMTTFHERAEITQKVILSIVKECREIGVPARLVVGTGHPSDENLIEKSLRHYARDIDLETIVVRQNQPGKRVAIGLALRAVSRRGVSRDTPVIFLDGDSILTPGCLRKCLPFFAMNPNLHALTTDEDAIVFGPRWMQKWLDLRFAQRHLAMQSHALSGKVLTLTGRMSIFRGTKVTDREFIQLVETDRLEHWLWGSFRFLSGDDKSTLYWLLKEGAEMLYIPDAVVLTVDRIEGNAAQRTIQNLLRWSGNMLRNGARAIALGPRPVGLFIWWCMIDQRIAMWTSLCAPIAMLSSAALVSSVYLTSYLIWILATRLFFSLLLFAHARRIDMTFPFLLYANQIAGAIVKIYILFRLPLQRWSNRQDQRLNFETGVGWKLKRLMASYLTTVYVAMLFFFVYTYVGLLDLPSTDTIRLLLGAPG